MLTAVMPAHNEEKTIFEVVKKAKKHVNEVIVVDDGSIDATIRLAREAGAKIVINDKRKGYIETLKTGFRQAEGDIIVTIDGDGEHNPEDIPLLLKPICDGKADLVLGARRKAARMSESLISWLTNLKVRIGDACTGFRAIRKDLALGLQLKGQCTCGTFVLEADYHGARVIEVPIVTITIDKPREIAWYHIGQALYVLG